MLIIHGENIQKSFDFLKQQTKDKKTKFIDCSTISPNELEQILFSESLFEDQSLYILKNVFKNKKYFKQNLALIIKKQNIIIYEEKDISKTYLKNFDKKNIKHFPLSSSLFKFLDNMFLSPKNSLLKELKQVIQENGDQITFFMIAYRIRQLIITKENGSFLIPTFLKFKLKNQSKELDIQKLLFLHTKLLQIDILRKTYDKTKTLSQELENFILKL